MTPLTTLVTLQCHSRIANPLRYCLQCQIWKWLRWRGGRNVNDKPIFGQVSGVLDLKGKGIVTKIMKDAPIFSWVASCHWQLSKVHRTNWWLSMIHLQNWFLHKYFALVKDTFTKLIFTNIFFPCQRHFYKIDSCTNILPSSNHSFFCIISFKYLNTSRHCRGSLSLAGCHCHIEACLLLRSVASFVFSGILIVRKLSENGQ